MDAGIILPLGRPCLSHLTNAERPVANWKEIRVDRPVDADWNRRNVALAMARRRPRARMRSSRQLGGA